MGCEIGHQYIDPGNICGGCGWRKPFNSEVFELTPPPDIVPKEPLADLEILAREYFRSYRVGWNQPSLEGLVRLLERVRAGA
jgi:hypothetical protein